MTKECLKQLISTCTPPRHSGASNHNTMDGHTAPSVAGDVPRPLSPSGWWNIPPSPKNTSEIPDLFITNLIDGNDAFMAGMASDMSGSGGSDTESSPASFQDFMLGTGISHDILDMQSQPPLGMDPTLSNYNNDPSLLSDEPKLYEPSMLYAQTADPPSLAAQKHDLFYPLSDLSSDGTPKKAAAPKPESPPATLAGLPVLAAGSHSDARSALETLRDHAKHVHAETRIPKPVKPAPAKEPVVQHTEETTEQPASKKKTHNAIERRYRSNINDRIAALRDVVPALRELRPVPRSRKRRRNNAAEEEIVDGVSAATKLNKATVLAKATEYITYLKSRETRLLREVSGLQMLLRSLQGGEELLALWSAEMARINNESAKEAPPPKPTGDDDIESDDDNSQASSESSLPQSAFLFSAFFGLSLFGGAAEWEEAQRSFAPPSHTRVVGATHQLVKRVSGSEWDSHHLDHVPAHQLVFELLRTAALIVGTYILVWSLYRWLRKPRQGTLPILQASFEARGEAEEHSEYQNLQHAVGAPTSTPGAVAALVSSAVPGPRSTADNVVARVLLRLVEIDVSTPCHQRAPWLQRYAHVRAAIRANARTPEVCAILALGYEALAEDAFVSGSLHKAAMRLWSSARVQLQSSENPSRSSLWLTYCLSLPLEQAYKYAIQSPYDEEQPVATPLNTIVDALRHEELLAFWTALLSSMVRSRDSGLFLDVLQDNASVDALRKRLATAAELIPYRTEATDEQILVARGTLALVSGQISYASACARLLGSECTTRAADFFVALLRDALPAAPEDLEEALDVLSCTTLAWIRLQRDISRGIRSEFAPQLHRLASTTLWMLVDTDDVEVKSRKLPDVLESLFFRTCQSRPVQGVAQLRMQPLTNSLDTLMDMLAEHL